MCEKLAVLNISSASEAWKLREQGKMKIGISSTCVWNMSPARGIRFARKAGVHSFEIWADHFFMWGESVQNVRSALKETGLEATLHAASWDLNITSLSKDTREFSIGQVKRSLVLAREVGAAIVTVHPGRQSFSGAPADRVMGLQREVFHELQLLNGKSGPKICVENIERGPKEVMVSEEDFCVFFEGMPAGLYVTMDIAHLETLRRVKGFYSALRGRIVHVHVSDVQRGAMHVPLGEGRLDIEEIAMYLKDTYRGIFSLEFFSEDKEGRAVKKSVSLLQEIVNKTTAR
jgi:sugar phosphate isomerase/epimerase